MQSQSALLTYDEAVFEYQLLSIIAYYKQLFTYLELPLQANILVLGDIIDTARGNRDIAAIVDLHCVFL